MLSSRKRLVLVLFGKKTLTTSTFRIENRVFGNKTSSRGRKSSFGVDAGILMFLAGFPKLLLFSLGVARL